MKPRYATIGAGILTATFAAKEAAAGCTRLPESRTRPIIEGFMIRPEGSMERAPRGETQLTQLIATVVAADPKTTLDPVIKLLRTANAYQKKAIGAGLGAAARGCLQNGDDPAARRIQGAIRSQADSTAYGSFASIFSGNPTAPSGLSTPAAADDPGRMTGGSIADPFSRLPISDPTKVFDPNDRVRPLR